MTILPFDGAVDDGDSSDNDQFLLSSDPLSSTSTTNKPSAARRRRIRSKLLSRVSGLCCGAGCSPRRLFMDVLVWFLVVWLVCLVRLRAVCWDEPTSYFFRPEEAHIPRYTAVRMSQALSFVDNYALQPPAGQLLSSLKGGDNNNNNNNNNGDENSNNNVEGEEGEGEGGNSAYNTRPPRLCVGSGSVKRKDISYLPATVGSLQDGLSREERASIHFAVLIGHTDPTQDDDYLSAWLPHLVDEVVTYNQDPDWMAEAVALELEGRHDPKHRFDYMLVLEACARSGAEHILVAEDDVLAMEGWYHRTLRAVDEAEKMAVERGHNNFFYLRLFYYEGLLGWNSESWLTYLTYSLLVTVAELCLLLFLRHRFPRTVRPHLPNSYVFALCLVCTPLAIGLFFLAGRNHVFPVPLGVSEMSDYACCGQGLLFPRDEVVEFLLPHFRASINDAHEDEAADSFVESYARAVGGLRYAVTPVVLQHVGGKSSHGPVRDKFGLTTPNKIFNFGFEDYDPQELHREHEAVVNELRKSGGYEEGRFYL